MEILTVVLIGALIMVGFMIFQDYREVVPFGKFSFSPFIYAGIIMIIGTCIVFCITSYQQKHHKTVLMQVNIRYDYNSSLYKVTESVVRK